MIDTTAAWSRAVAAWHDDTTHPTWSNDSLRRVLIALGDTDQAMRHGISSLQDTAVLHRLARADSAHQVQLRAIVAKYGWPTRSLVGARGETAAWLIVQHSADSMEQAGLKLITAAAPGEVPPAEIAYLTDRVREMANRPQLYGTQYTSDGNGKWKVYPIEDSAHVDERRAAAGMVPLIVYTTCGALDLPW